MFIYLSLESDLLKRGSVRVLNQTKMWLIIFVFSLILLIYKLYKVGQYWKERGLIHEPYFPVVGNMGNMFFKNKNFIEVFNDIYSKYPEYSYVGIYQFMKPVIMVRNLQIIKQISVKDFDHFSDHSDIIHPDSEPLFAKNLFTLKGQEWKDTRGTLSPAFTSAKMKNMFHFMKECAKNLTKHYDQSQGIVEENVKEFFSRFANDIIATTAFGIQVDSFANKDNEFYRMGKKLTTFTTIRGLLFFILHNVPGIIIRIFKIRLFPRDTLNYFVNIIEETILKRRSENIVRPDVLQLLLEAKKGNLRHEGESDPDAGFATVHESDIGKASSNKKQWTDEDIVAQCLLFFFGGFDTISTGACYLAYELAINPDVQKKLQEEIDDIINTGNDVDYETLLKMKYLDQVVTEALRKWPPAVFTDRICTKDYTLEPLTEKDTKFTIIKGEVLTIPTACIHMDPKYYPNPEKFDPDRFSDENKDKLVPGSYMPFGVGPRNCIGSRFALLEVKVLIFYFLSKFDIVPVKRTKIPYRVPSGKISPNPEDLILGFKLR